MVRATRDWFQALFCVYALLFSGFSLVDMDRYGGSILNRFPVGFQYVFAAWLGVSSVLVMWGMFRSYRKPSELSARSWDQLVRSILTERAGLIMFGSLGLVYAVLSWVVFGEAAARTAFLWLTVVVASYLRAWDLSPRRARRKARNHGD